MPVIESKYNPPFIFKKGHFSTVYSGLFRNVNGIAQKRERITLADEDFLDLDWSFSENTSDKLVIILHGLGGNAQRPYMLGTAKLFNQNNYDTVCVNFRNCSETPNLKYKSYHSGATDDLHEVINYILKTKRYTELYVIGFSLGGNLALKYLGEREVDKNIKGAVAVSVPCSLFHSMLELHKFKNILYANRFKQHLIEKLTEKQALFPEFVSKEDIKSIKTLKDFDDVYTSKAHGFKDAQDYYEKCSCLQFLSHIKTPTLLINAIDDSFLSPECFPIKEAKQNQYLFLEMPPYGGHVGFYGKSNVHYNEIRSLDFIKNSI